MSSQNPVFIPGPTNIPERLRHACNVPTIDHRSASFGAIFKPLFAGREGRVLKTEDGEVIIFPATGTAGWEAAISNTLSPGDKVLACRHGMFSHRWIDMCKRHGLERPAAQRPLGRRRAGRRVPGRAQGRQEPRDQGRPRHPQRDRDRRALRRRRRPQGDGRSQAPRAPPRRRRQLDRLMDFRMDEWGVDVAVTGSQKGFMLPTGLAIVGVSPKALEGNGDGEAAALLPRLPRHARAPTPRAASPTPRRSTSSTASASR